MHTTGEGGMSDTEENKRLIEEHYAALWAGDEAALRRQVAEDFVDHGTPGGVVGIDAIIAHSKSVRPVFPDMQVRFRQRVAEGDRVAVHVVWRGTHSAPFMGVPATGRTIEFEGMVFWRIAGSKIAERWAVLDTPALLRQLQSA
jgi:steroid delta-isomerase-like uncharacterized protein